MIKVLILEDEPPAIKRLTKLLVEADQDIEIVHTIDSVDEAVGFLKNNDKLDLIFSDIQLADGNSFEIFEQVKPKVPVIFATAYDDYMLQAFKVNSIDYLLKPYDQEDVQQALDKYSNWNYTVQPQILIEELVNSIKKKSYKKRFLVKRGKELSIIPVEEIAYFYSEDGYAHLACREGGVYIVEYTLDSLVEVLEPQAFFRINRKFFISPESIKKIHPYFNSRLKLELAPACKMEVVVSREKVNLFKNWIDA